MKATRGVLSKVMVITKIRAVQRPMPFDLQIYRIRDMHGLIKLLVSQLRMLKRTIEETPVSRDVLWILEAQPSNSGGPGSIHNVRSGKKLAERVSVGANMGILFLIFGDSLRWCETSPTVGPRLLSCY